MENLQATVLLVLHFPVFNTHVFPFVAHEAILSKAPTQQNFWSCPGNAKSANQHKERLRDFDYVYRALFYV